MSRILNIGLRGLTLLNKFLLVFFLAHFMNAEDVGIYGLVAATIGYGVYVVGFEFYNYSNRELVIAPQSEWLPLIRDQFLLYLLIYVVTLPFIVTVFWGGWLPWPYFSIFVTLLLLEHIAQEFNRILVAASKQLLASVVLFVRSGIWCLVVILCMWFDPVFRTLQFTFYSWIISCLFACIIAIYQILRLGKLRGSRPVNWTWIRNGIKVALPFLLASLAIRGIYTFDKYFVDSVSNLQVLGAYTIFVGMATAVLSFLDAGVFVFYIPRLIRSAKNESTHDFQKVMRELTINTVIVIFFLSVLCCFAGILISNWLSSPVYKENLDMLYWLLFASALYGLSTIPHLGLYAYGRDRPILHSQLCGFCVFILSAYLFSSSWGVSSIAVSMAISFFFIFAWKISAY
ncbi:TPA: hypothetical protein VEO97_006283, partial [Pseudomonas aeruginosa]|nr:hypothetical protein [Pseudomonas aeruginosa]HEQ2018575.1 hypothetical protein [Pseudomonas aeruginosa]